MATVARTTRTSGPAADTARDPGLHNRRSGCPLHGIRCCPGCCKHAGQCDYGDCTRVPVVRAAPPLRCDDCGGLLDARPDPDGRIIDGCVCDGPWAEPGWAGA